MRFALAGSKSAATVLWLVWRQRVDPAAMVMDVCSYIPRGLVVATRLVRPWLSTCRNIVVFRGDCSHVCRGVCGGVTRMCLLTNSITLPVGRAWVIRNY